MITIHDQHDHVLRCDIYRYLPAVDHALLKDMFRRRVVCCRTLALLGLIVDGSNVMMTSLRWKNGAPRIERYLEGGVSACIPIRRSPTKTATFLGFELHADGGRSLPDENVRRFRNRLRGLRDQWRAGTIGLADVEPAGARLDRACRERSNVAASPRNLPARPVCLRPTPRSLDGPLVAGVLLLTTSPMCPNSASRR